VKFITSRKIDFVVFRKEGIELEISLVRFIGDILIAVLTGAPYNLITIHTQEGGLYGQCNL